MANLAQVRMNHAGVRTLLSSAAIRGALSGPASAALAAAKAGAPVATGAYRDSLRVTYVITDRAVARIGSTVSYALIVEARTGNLARALGSA